MLAFQENATIHSLPPPPPQTGGPQTEERVDVRGISPAGDRAVLTAATASLALAGTAAASSGGVVIDTQDACDPASFNAAGTGATG
jgi:RecA/RadA recombinase